MFPETAHYFKNKEVFPLQKIIKEDKKGYLTIESKISNLQEARQLIMPWVPYISIVQPKNLKDEIKKLLELGFHKI